MGVDVFIRRPVATFLLALGLFLAGMTALWQLPVAPLPRTDFPTINISARLPGANPETVAATLAAPLERRLGEIAGVAELTSTSSVGSASITVQFDLSRDINGAAQDVQAAINAAMSDLPADLPSPPTYRKVNPADTPIMILALRSDTISPAKLYDLGDSILAQRISQVPGVSQVTVSGAEKPAIRVRVNPQRLAAMGLGMEDVRSAIASANSTQAQGELTGADLQSWTLDSTSRLSDAASYARIVVRESDGRLVRLSDLAQVSESVENTRQAGWYNNARAVLLIIFKQPDANVVEITDQIRGQLPQYRSWLPEGVDLSLVSDRTGNIRATLADVELTLVITIILVVLVVLASLGRLIPTLAASITVPLSLAGTFAVMWGLGYSLNNISLMALIVAVGFVVDDSIVMLENITRHMERGLSVMDASVTGAREITFTVVSITVSLIAVFIPLLFMGGIIGRLFREFSVTLAVSIAVSALVSLTVTPTLYAHLMGRVALRHQTHWGERVMGWLCRQYERVLRRCLRLQPLMLGVMIGTIGLTVYLYTIVPKGFFPPQDTGLILVSTDGRADLSFQGMSGRHVKAMEIILADPAVHGVASFLGGGGTTSQAQGRMFVSLKPLDERGASAQEVINRLRPQLSQVIGIQTFLMAGQDIRIGGRPSRAMFQFTLLSESLDDLKTWTPRLVEKLKDMPGLADVNSDMDAAIPQLTIQVDRDRAAQLGVDMQEVDAALQSGFAQRQVSTIYGSRNQYKVVLELEPAYLTGPHGLTSVYVRTNAGGLVPLSSFARLSDDLAPVSVNHQGPFPAATLSFNLPPGQSLSEASALVQKAALDIGMPPSVRAGFSGQAKAFADSMSSQPLLILAALLAIYVVLGMLYESWLHPLTIISTLPSAGIGALLALLAFGAELSLISVIGIILLMGIVKKNGIMLVDFAISAEMRGASPLHAMRRACRNRFRPITMTTLTALLGAVPLVIAHGPGASLRQPLGIAIVGGLLLSQILTLFTTPVVYLALARLKRRFSSART